MIDDGIFKTKHTCLIGSKRVDAQWLRDIEARAKRMRDAVDRPIVTKQIKLPRMTDK